MRYKQPLFYHRHLYFVGKLTVSVSLCIRLLVEIQGEQMTSNSASHMYMFVNAINDTLGYTEGSAFLFILYNKSMQYTCNMLLVNLFDKL